MKRKTLLSIAVAVLLVAAMAATAFAASDSSLSVSGPGSISTGQTIEIAVSGTGLGVSADVEIEGLEYVGVSNAFSGPNGVVLLPAFGPGSVVYTYTVTAEAGETASFRLVNATATGDDDSTFSIPGDSWSATVPAGEEPSDQPTEEPSTAPSGTPSGGGSSSGGNSGSGSGNADKMPKTGDATVDLWVLAVIAAGCTGAAVVAGKKVFAK